MRAPCLRQDFQIVSVRIGTDDEDREGNIKDIWVNKKIK